MLVQFVFFFFQAEDGIRDYKVTGVQTCALPISIVGFGRPGEQEASRVQGDETIGELVLDRLEVPNELTELLAHLGVLYSQLEGAVGRSVGACNTAKSGKRGEARQTSMGNDLARHVL